MSDKTDLGTRMKEFYENRERHYLTRRTPVIIRVDGRAFHTLTRKAEKPFDMNFITIMQKAAIAVAADIQGFKAGIIQSDEASFLLTDDDTLTTEAWFDYNLQKMVSISAALMTAHFNRISSYCPDAKWMEARVQNMPVFDARAFNIPKEEVANYFLWRGRDWFRNSVQMLARSRYSQKELHGLGRDAMLTKLEADGVRWNELPDVVKNGTWLSVTPEVERRASGGWGITPRTDIRPDYASVSTFIKECLAKPEED